MGSLDDVMTLKKLRKGAGYRTSGDFAHDFGIPQTTYSRYEREMQSIPTEKLIKLADWFGVPMDWVVGRKCTHSAGRGAQQEVYDLLSPRGKSEVDKFMAYQMFLDGKESQNDD